MSSVCASCGKTHEKIPLDVAYNYPLSYYRVPENERDTRVVKHSEFFVIDENTFIIRGTLCLPIKKQENKFCWGVWALVSKQTLANMWAERDSDSSGIIYDGVLDGDIQGFPDTFNLDIEVHPGDIGKRPTFKIKDTSTPLGIAQSEGVDLNQIHEIQHIYFG